MEEMRFKTIPGGTNSKEDSVGREEKDSEIERPHETNFRLEEIR
jgi:hypothetical protein